MEVHDFPKRFFNKNGFETEFIHTKRMQKVPNLWVMWKRGLSKPTVLSSSEQHISMSSSWQKIFFSLSVVHAKCFKQARRELWVNLTASYPGPGIPWMVIGDFNATLQSHEKRGPGAFNMGSEADFTAMVDGCSLIQVPSKGRKFTWTNNRRRGNVVVVLDRTFCNDSWFSTLHDCHHEVMYTGASDHSPLLVTSESLVRPNNYPFRFQRFWTENESFMKVVKESWDEWISGSAIYVFSQKIKRLKGAIRPWAKQNVPNINLELEAAQKGMEEVQGEIEINGMNGQIFSREADAKTRLLKAMENHEKLWAEKARMRWRTQGDRCSKFFHVSAKIRRLKNSIHTLKKEDKQIISDNSQLEDYVSGFYENFLKGSETSEHLDLLDCIPKVLDDHDRWRLDVLPSNAEIKEAVWELDLESAPGPDGFPDKFYRSCWEIINLDVCNAVRSFFNEGRMPNVINTIFLVLIPKVEGAMSLDKFRPLCLGNFFCKIFSKIMVTRLSGVLHRLISKEQGAFQKGKIIHSNISVVSELTNLLFSTARGGGMGLKIDIQKAYDTMSWRFIFQVLMKFGFSERWVLWVHQMLGSTKISVLNGGPIGYFGVERGLRQGDPLSPMLFILAEEVLCRGLQRLVVEKKFKVLNGPRGVMTPAHSLFADDIFIFGNASLSFAVYWWPNSLINTLERWMRNFVWTREVDNAKKIVINWDQCCKPKEEGGLGLRRLRDINKTMLCKSAWRIKTEESMASSFLRARFLDREGIPKKGFRKSSIWPGLRKIWDYISSKER
ncbi:uncharacterized protein LOC122064574 [Macadamia integrifolia]|uniref:uncharacterized protein LOC122064574 n=1 Tax=Macadamia integrifolia TaxID=60698 RepID=UPI001C502140|nr:uncharacterized protein LOC122064574 [Macadamia integrifolia]